VDRRSAFVALAGALIAFGFLAGFSIGLPFFCLGLALALGLLVTRPRAAAAPGAAAGEIPHRGLPGAFRVGVALVLLVIGAMNVGYVLGVVLIALGAALLLTVPAFPRADR
jgi:hypothetical protein